MFCSIDKVLQLALKFIVKREIQVPILKGNRILELSLDRALYIFISFKLLKCDFFNDILCRLITLSYCK